MFIKPKGVSIYKIDDNHYDIFIQNNSSKFVYFIQIILNSTMNMQGKSLALNNYSKFKINKKMLIQNMYS